MIRNQSWTTESPDLARLSSGFVVAMVTALPLIVICLIALVNATGASMNLPGVGPLILMAMFVGVVQMCLPCGPNASVGVSYTYSRQPPNAADIGARIVVLTLAALVSSATFGLVLGFVGRILVNLNDLTAIIVLALVSLVLGVISLLPIRRHIPQFDRETPPPWTRNGPFVWAITDGGMLGLGWATRIQYASWYVIPIAAIVYSHPMVGAVIYGAYGMGRMWGTWLIPILPCGKRASDSVSATRLLSMIPKANSICGIASLAVGVFLFNRAL